MDHSLYFPSLSSKKKLERDKGLEIVKQLLGGGNEDDIKKLEGNILELFASNDSWEATHGALCASALMVEAGVCSNGLYKEVEKIVPVMLDHSEARLRLAAGLCKGVWSIRWG